MKKNTKLADALGVIAVFAVFAGCAETLDGSPSAWNLVCLAVAGLAGFFSNRLTSKERKAK